MVITIAVEERLLVVHPSFNGQQSGHLQRLRRRHLLSYSVCFRWSSPPALPNWRAAMSELPFLAV
jgi:hypothetical protein